MMRTLASALFIVLQLAGPLFADRLNEIKIKGDLEELFRKAVAQKSFVIHVSGTYKTQTDKKLSENEIIRQKQAAEQVPEVQRLPGFDVAPRAPAGFGAAEYNREIYHFSDNEVLTTLLVQVFHDEKLDAAVVDKLKATAQAYLGNLTGAKYALTFSPIEIGEEAAVLQQNQGALPWYAWLAFVLGACVILVLAALVMWLLLKRSRPEPVKAAAELGANVPIQGDFMPVDNTKLMRSEFLKRIVEHAEPFRSYFDHLSADKKSALIGHLGGPAFGSIMTALNLKAPETEGGESGTSAEEFDLPFFIRDFAEYVSAHVWHKVQFFGFLNQADFGKLVALFREQKPLDIAVITRFLPAERVSAALNQLSPEKRFAIMQQFNAASALSLEEISKIEQAVRLVLSGLPSVGENLSKKSADFWADVVMNSPDQDQILADIEAAMPELYPALTKLRFKLEDIPTLPAEKVARVLSELDNQQLALALTNMSEDLVNFILDNVVRNRRPLITSQMSTLAGSSEEEIRHARLEMAAQFRKVIT